MQNETSKQLSTDEKLAHKEYANALAKRGFCIIYDSQCHQTPILNRVNKARLPISYLQDEFRTSYKGFEFSFPYLKSKLKRVIGSIFKPSAEPQEYFTDSTTGCTYVNTYRRYVPEIDSAEVSPLLIEFFERLIKSEDERKTVLQWLAHIFQRPQERPSWHLMFPSDTGTGKGFLVEHILTPLLHHTSTVADYSKLTGRFSQTVSSNVLILIDDAKARSDATQTQLKSLLSEERVFVEQKGGSEGMQATFARMILASNEHRPLYLDASERRWYVTSRLEHKDNDRDQTAQFIAKLAKWLEEPYALDKVYNWFMQIDLTDFNHKSVPYSTGLQEMIAMSVNPYAVAISEFTLDNKVFDYAEVVNHMTGQGLSKPSDKELAHLIREAGFEKSRIPIDKEKPTLYYPKDMQPSQVRMLWKSEKDNPQPPF